MSIKFLLLCLVVLLMASTVTTNAYRKREWRKKQEGYDPEMLQELVDFLEQLDQFAKTMEENVGSERR